MKWPWTKEIDAVRDQARAAAEEHAYTTQDRLDAEAEQQNVMEYTAKLRSGLQVNGWTELLQESWGGSR